jgi:hypothetical protein
VYCWVLRIALCQRHVRIFSNSSYGGGRKARARNGLMGERDSATLVVVMLDSAAKAPRMVADSALWEGARTMTLLKGHASVCPWCCQCTTRPIESG